MMVPEREGPLTMKFYDCATAPSPRRVRIFLTEKGIEVPTVQVDLRAGEQFGEPFRRLNPWCTVPVLELDDGTAISEAVAICRYLEERFADSPLMGRDPREKAIIAMWEHRCEVDGFLAAQEAFRNRAPGLKGRALTGATDVEQISALADRGRARVLRFFAMLDERLADCPFVSGEAFSIADITLLVTVDFAAWAKVPMPGELSSLRRWYEMVSARPSAKA
ncbi:MAG: glutathione S-transferase family protein [Rhodospirillales bacterium]|jgi:glutathione S-transferase|nr:glutathione S-transferase family protein [Rhodospirillales bacterium]